ncbi:hypothetical protein F2P47_10695 [Parvibaculum sedimenti]|uniref:Uncharacterized protein n=1 Tax=Parvibaculum sedimenti TaxID=2608632 RepID=A0A6N6VGE8_9HYPH|nr:hypothetical protein [Parvibaculum sedimenti]KAB7739963.1 hypothetical protein F2P47_10695 [Parvibaculum sedimenti]
MKEVRYQLLFEGKVTPEDEMGSRMRIETRASFGAGLDPVFTTGAPQAVLEAVVEPDQYGHFTEQGQIVFGGGTVNFVNEGEGLIGECPDPSQQYGYVIRRIVSGTGAFEGATGYMVSAFTVGENAMLRDSQSAVIFLA